jgi:hypothetical protein
MNRFFSTLLALMLISITTGCADKAQTESMDSEHTPMADMSDKDMVVEALSVNAESFKAMVDGLTPEQLAFQESPDRWSIAGVAEHIIATETFFKPMLTSVLISEVGHEAKSDSAATDEFIVSVMADRTQQFEAPPTAQPSGKFTSSEDIIAAFDAAREKTIAMVSAADVDLRGVSGVHPALGTLDGAQWFLFVAAHADRHVDQMAQVKADTAYPHTAM